MFHQVSEQQATKREPAGSVKACPIIDGRPLTDYFFLLEEHGTLLILCFE